MVTRTEFLQAFGPDVSVTEIPMSAKGIKGKVVTHASANPKWDKLDEHIAARVGSANIYFSPNATATPLQVKPSNDEIALCRAAHVDLDARVGETPEDATARGLKALQGYDPPPSIIVASGGGVQGFWLFDKPTSDKARVTRINQQVAADLGGDHCHDVSRIMRMPLTINLPDKKKLDKGRVPAESRVIAWHPERRYSLDALRAMPVDKPKEQPEGTVAPAESKFTPEQFDDLLADENFTAAKLIPTGKEFRDFICAVSDATGHAQWAIAKLAKWMALDAKWPNGSADAFDFWSRVKDDRPNGVTQATFYKVVSDAGCLHHIKAYSAAPVFSMLGNPVIAPRNWLAQNTLLNGAVTLMTGPSGGGKSVLNLHVAIAAVLGQPWAVFGIRRAVNVLYVNAEDDIEELDRRIDAALHSFKGHRLDNGAIIRKRLHTVKASNYYLIAKDDKGVSPTKLHKILRDYIKANDIGLVVFDPMISAHIGIDENSAELQVLLECFRNIATQMGIAVLLTHHNKKAGNAGDADAARGSSTAVAAVRIVLNVDPMTEKEGGELLTNAVEFGSYFSLANSKANYSAKQRKAWFKIESIDVGYDETAPGLQQVTFVDANLTDDQMIDLLAAIDEGMPDADGKVTRYTSRGPDDVRLDAMIATDFGMSSVQAKAIIKRLVSRGQIELKGYTRPNRKAGKGYFVRDPLPLTGGAS